MHRIPVGILGASGFAGRELARHLGSHPGFHVVFASANERRGQYIEIGGRTVTMEATDEVNLSAAELVFSALPHGASGEWVQRVAAAGKHAIDLSSDLRPGHTQLDVPYGLTEVHRAQLRHAQVVANPGCYPTAVLLGLLPLLENDLIEPGACITIDAASGVSGAGNSPKPELMFSEVGENFRAYAVGNEHRHLPEMQATVSSFGRDIDLLFTPHLLPIIRGILATITVPLRTMPDDLLGLWAHRYQNEAFVEVSADPPAIRDVVHRNVARISVRKAANVRRPTAIIIAAIDNLLKGAAGQAIQNANVVFQLPEPAGLPL